MPAKPKKTAKPKTKPKKDSLVKFKVTKTGVVIRVSTLGFAAAIPRDFTLPIVLAIKKGRSQTKGKVPPVRDDKVNKNKT